MYKVRDWDLFVCLFFFSFFVFLFVFAFVLFFYQKGDGSS